MKPFLHRGWYEAWVKGFGTEGILEWLEVENGELPLVVDGRVGRAPANTHTHLYGPAAASEGAERELARLLAERRFERVLMPYMDPGTAFVDECRKLWPRRIEHVMQRSPYVSLESGDIDAWRAGLERKFRKELARLRRRLSELGELTFDFGDDLSDLDEGFRLEASGWKLEAGTAIVQKPQRVAFYRALAEWARSEGMLQLAFVRLDGRPIAFDFCLADGTSVYALKGGYDPELRKHGPGFVLTEEGIARAFAAGAQTYELLGDADEYKLNFTSLTRERIHFEGFSGSPRGRARHLARTRVRPLVKRLRER